MEIEVYSSNGEEYFSPDAYDAICDCIHGMPDDDWLEGGIIKVFRGETYGDPFHIDGEESYSIRNVKELAFKITNYDEDNCDFEYEEVVDDRYRREDT